MATHLCVCYASEISYACLGCWVRGACSCGSCRNTARIHGNCDTAPSATKRTPDACQICSVTAPPHAGGQRNPIRIHKREELPP